MSKTAMKMLSAIIALSCAGTSAMLTVSADTGNEVLSGVNAGTESTEIIYGDANCDSDVDVRDLTAVKKHILKLSALSEKGIENCDFFGDGEITVKSLGQMCKYFTKVIDKLEFIGEQETAVNFSVAYAGYPACDFEGIKVYKSAEELHKDFTSEDFEKYDEKYFSENVLCIKSIYVNSAFDEMIVDTVEKDADGNFIVNVLEIFNEAIHTDEVMLGYTVCMEISADEYTGQDFEIKMSEKTGAADYNFAISDYAMGCGDDSAICTTYEEFCAFIDENYSPWPEFVESETLAMYDEKFFKDNVLFISGYSKNFGMMQPAFDYISVTDEEITLGMIRDYSQEYAVEDLNGCMVSFYMSKDEYKGQKFTVKSKNINQNDEMDYYFNTTNYSADEPDSNIAPVICTTYEELTAYIDEYISANPNTLQDSIAELPKIYDEEFFEEYVLCVGREEITTGKREINFNSIEYVGDSIILMCDRDKTVKQEEYKSCFVSVAISKDTYKGQKDFRIGFTDETNTEDKPNTENANTKNPFIIRKTNHSGFDLFEFENANKPIVITSYQEFMEYTDSFEVRVYLTDDEVTDVSISLAENLIEKYDAEFFENNVLFVEAVNGDVSIMAENSITKDENGNFILNVEYSDVITTDPVVCFVGFELDKSEYDNQTFTIKCKEEKEIQQEPAIYDFVSVMTGYNSDLEFNYGENSRKDAYTSAEEFLADYPGMTQYNEEFFKYNVLYMTTQLLPSGSITVAGKSVEKDENGNFILNIYEVGPMTQTCNMSGCIVGFRVPRSEYNGQTLEKVVHNTAVYEYYDEAYNGETEGEMVSGDLINTDDYVNVMVDDNLVTVYNSETLTSFDELKDMLNENADETEKSALLEKYNEEFFKSYDIAVVKFASIAGEDYLAENASVIGGYYNYDGSGYYANVQIGTTPFSGDKVQDNCIILKFAKEDNVKAVNVEFCPICID